MISSSNLFLLMARELKLIGYVKGASSELCHQLSCFSRSTPYLLLLLSAAAAIAAAAPAESLLLLDDDPYPYPDDAAAAVKGDSDCGGEKPASEPLKGDEQAK